MKFSFLTAILFCATSNAVETFNTVYQVRNLDKVPRYSQANESGTIDGNICFAAAAAQAIDFQRYNVMANQERFVPSSPLLLANRFHYIRQSEDGEQGGSAMRVMEHTIQLGNCTTIVAPNVYEDGVFTLEEEVSAIISRAPANAVKQSLTQAVVIDEAYHGVGHTNFYTNTFQLCQNGSGSRPGELRQFPVTIFENGRGVPLTDAKWNQALAAVQSPSQGAIPAILNICNEVLESQPPAPMDPAIAAIKGVSETTQAANCSPHVVTLLGKRCPSGNTTECQLLIRDSYIRNSLPAGAEYFSEIPNDRNDFWISESTIKAVTSLFTIFNPARAGN
jgi:hypothetical protein